MTRETALDREYRKWLHSPDAHLLANQTIARFQKQLKENSMTLEQLLRITVPVGPGCVAPEGTPMSPDFRIAVQEITADGVRVIVHPIGHNGETLDLNVVGNTVTRV